MINVAEEDTALFEKIIETMIEEEEIEDFLVEQQKRKAKKVHVRKRSTHRTAILLAKANGDPLYDKYVRYSSMMRAVREKILKKYSSKAKTLVVRRMASPKKKR